MALQYITIWYADRFVTIGMSIISLSGRITDFDVYLRLEGGKNLLMYESKHCIHVWLHVQVIQK